MRDPHVSEYQAWLRRERRRELLHSLARGAGIGLAAVVLAGTMYLALIGFTVVFG